MSRVVPCERKNVPTDKKASSRFYIFCERAWNDKKIYPIGLRSLQFSLKRSEILNMMVVKIKSSEM
jgi:hypothetical protein